MVEHEIKKVTTRHRRAAMAGGLAGLSLLVGYICYEYAMTPARPDVHAAKAAEIVAYISNERGLGKLSRIEEQEFLVQWREAVMGDNGKKDDLRDCLAGLEEQDRKPFVESMFKYGKRAFLDDAKLYLRMSRDDQYAFLRKKITDYREQVLFMKDIADGLKTETPGTQDDFQRWVIEHSTPEERTLGEPYVDALKHVRVQMKKEERASTSLPVDAEG